MQRIAIGICCGLLLLLAVGLTVTAQDDATETPDLAATVDALSQLAATQSAQIMNLEATVSAMLPPVYTPISADQVILTEIANADFSISIPEHFVGGIIPNELDALRAASAELPDISTIANSITGEFVPVFAFDPAALPDQPYMSIGLIVEPNSQNYDLESYRTDTFANVQDNVDGLIDEGIIMFENGSQTFRIVIGFPLIDHEEAVRIEYSFFSGSNFYRLVVAATVTHLDDYLPIFDAIAASFVPVVSPEPTEEITPVVTEEATQTMADMTQEATMEATEPMMDMTEEMMEATEPMMDMTEEPMMDMTEEPMMDMTEEPMMDMTEEPMMEPATTEESGE